MSLLRGSQAGRCSRAPAAGAVGRMPMALSLAFGLAFLVTAAGCGRVRAAQNPKPASD